MTSQVPGALLFDIDGTLAHTDPLHIRAFNAMLEKEGRSEIPEAEYLQRVMGNANFDIFNGYFPDRSATEQKALADWKEAKFRELAATELHPMTGLLALMDFADSTGIPMAAVTNAPRANADLMLNGLGLRARFRTVVIGDELPRGKPDPLPYLTACERLAVPADRCVAFEDSRSGVTAAHRAGAFTIGMMSSLQEAPLKAAGARYGVADFTDSRIIADIRHVVMG